jgi:type I restriction enzyme S subunit
LSDVLPCGWAEAQLPDLIDTDGVFVDGDWVESKDQDPDGEIRLIQLADIGDGRFVDKSRRFLTKQKAVELGCTFLKRGDVLVARMPNPLGRACLFPGDRRESVTVVDVCVIRGQERHVDNRWLMHFINAPKFRLDIDALQSGSTRKRISRGNLSTINLPVPPRTEQTRLVEKLEELLSDLDAGVAELKAAQRKLAQYRQSLLKAAVEGALTADWRAARAQSGDPQETGAALLQRILAERRTRWGANQLAKSAEQGKSPPKDWKAKYKEPVAPDITDLPTLPDGWVWATLDQLADSVRNGLSQKPNTDGVGYPILRINAVRTMSVQLDEVRHLNLTTDEASPYLLDEGDLLATRYNGSVDLLGVVGVVRNLTRPTLHPDKLIRIKPVLGTPLADWIEMCASTGASRAHVVSRVKTTAGQTGISGSDIKQMPIPLAPLWEQVLCAERMAAEILGTGDVNRTIEHGLKQATAQRKNILKAAFAGQLVPQDPNDEPASALLERIRAERATPGATATRRRRKLRTTA